jgi:hypothetical protein
MNRKSFLNRISSFFQYNKELNNSLVSLTLENEEANTLFNLIKKDTSSEKLTHYFLHSTEISNFMTKTENTYQLDIYSKLNIEINLDHYQLSDYDNLVYNITFNPNELYDFVINDYYENELELITLYRVEDKHFTGIYNAGLANINKASYSQPAPFNDGDINQVFTESSLGLQTPYTQQWFFAFSSLEDVYKLFNPDIIDVSTLISLYTIPKKISISGKKQTIFKKDYATYLGRYIST